MTMDPRLQAWLDGELPDDDLPASLRAEASDWTHLLDDVRSLPAPGAAPGSTARVMQAIEAEAGDGFLAGALSWLVRPRPIRLSPLAAAAVLTLVALAATRLAGPSLDPAGAAADGRVFVQFVISAPGARTVALAGDFNEWDPSIELSDPDGDGIWSARVGLRAGVHEYMFVIDGTEWRPDPNALSYTADGFGQRNSVLAVTPLDDT